MLCKTKLAQLDFSYSVNLCCCCCASLLSLLAKLARYRTQPFLIQKCLLNTLSVHSLRLYGAPDSFLMIFDNFKIYKIVVKYFQDINLVWIGKLLLILWGIMNYENFALFLKTPAGRNKLLINLDRPGLAVVYLVNQRYWNGWQDYIVFVTLRYSRTCIIRTPLCQFHHKSVKIRVIKWSSLITNLQSCDQVL